MYNAKQEPNEFVGDDRDEAVGKACRFFGVSEDDLKIVSPPRDEVLGSGTRMVLVAVPKDAKPIAQSGSSDRGDRRDRGDRERGGRGREGGDRERGGRGRGDRGRGRERDRGPRADRPEREHDREVVRPKSEAPKTESKGQIEGEIGEAGQFIVGIVERMQLGEFTISESTEGDFVVYELRGEAAVALGAGDGRATDALQLLGNQFSMQSSDDGPRVVVDTEGNAQKRSDFLERLARRAVDRAAETKRAVALDPMNGRDRRVLHIVIREMEGVTTMSDGEGRFRRVVVVPEGADEYEEALASSRAAESND